MRSLRARSSDLAQPEPPFRSLLYRDFFFGWLFRDASRGSFLERTAAWRFNRQRSRYLPRYLRRWLLLVLLSYAIGLLFERNLALDFAAAFFYCITSLAVAMSVLIAGSWLGFQVEG